MWRLFLSISVVVATIAMLQLARTLGEISGKNVLPSHGRLLAVHASPDQIYNICLSLLSFYLSFGISLHIKMMDG